MSTPSPDEPSAVMPPVQPSGSAPDAIKQQRRWLIVLAVMLFIVIAGLLAHFWLERQDTVRLREEMARRLQTGDTVSTEVKGIAKSTQDTVLDLQARLAALESRQMESQSQHASLEQMYQELARNRDERVLADLEQILMMANQRLQLTSNVHSALIALENADRLLAREDKPQFIGIRRALAKDIERLRAVPHVDVTGMAVKLDVVTAQIETLPLLSDARLSPEPKQEEVKKAADEKREQPETEAAGEKPKGSWFSPVSGMWKRWSSEFWGEVRTLVHVRNVESPEALILSPEQAYFLREKLTLRLLGARVAMLARDQASFSGDMKAALKIIETYFDPASQQVQAARTALSRIMENNVAVEMPDLSESLTAVQNYRTKP